MQSSDRLYDIEIRKVICSANAIESLNARSRRAVLVRGRFPNDPALRCLYPVTRVPRPGRRRPDQVGQCDGPGDQRIRHHLRRPVPGRRDLLTNRG
jgi:hypothetical protein